MLCSCGRLKTASWNTKIASNVQPSPLTIVRTMEDFLESFSFVSSRFCFVISLSCVREAVKRGKIPTWIGRLLESPGSHYTRRKLNIPTMLMRRTDKAYPLKLRSSFRIKVEDDERGTLLLPWIHRDTQKILRKRKDAEFFQVSGSWRAGSFVYLLV